MKDERTQPAKEMLGCDEEQRYSLYGFGVYQTR